MTELEVRSNWAEALESVRKGTELSGVIGWGLSDNDILELARLHKANKFRKKIEDLLTDCNFHYECGRLSSKEYEQVLEEYTNEGKAKRFISAIKIMASKPDTIDNFESYLSCHFDKWFNEIANTPNRFISELEHFASIE